MRFFRLTPVRAEDAPHLPPVQLQAKSPARAADFYVSVMFGKGRIFQIARATGKPEGSGIFEVRLKRTGGEEEMLKFHVQEIVFSFEKKRRLA